MSNNNTQKPTLTVAVEAAEGRFTITINARPVRTPAGEALDMPSEALASAIADEWRSQGDNIRPHTMPLTRLAATAIDRIGRERQPVVDSVANYAITDLLCYRAEFPADLAERQRKSWQPLLDWVADTYKASLKVTCGITPVKQSEQTIETLRAVIEALDDMELSAISTLTAASGSIAISLALAAGRIDAEEAFAVSRLDETFQNERWGLDEEAVASRRVVHDDILSAAAFLTLHRKV